MDLHVSWSSEVSAKHPGLAVSVGLVEDVIIGRSNAGIIELRNQVKNTVVREHQIATLKDNPTIRAYRDFYWKLGVDPTKTRPSGEALLRRILRGRGIPSISTVVDAYNLASLGTMIPISGFDRDLLNDPLQVRFADANEKFLGIGMNVPQLLDKGSLVLADQERILCIYPYRDSNQTKISLTTKNVWLIVYGAPGISPSTLQETLEKTVAYIKKVSGGRVSSIAVSAARNGPVS